MAKIKVDQRERAHRAWPILIRRTKIREPYTYGQLAKEMGVHPRVCSYFLGLIQEYCFERKLPPLQSIVVNKKTHLPGEGYIATSCDRKNIKRAQERVYDYAWNKIGNPF